MTEDADDLIEVPMQLFGDPRSALIERGSDRRTAAGAAAVTPVAVDHDLTPIVPSQLDPGHAALRSGRGDGFATLLMVVGILVFGGTAIAATLILYNAKNVGAFSNPWDSTRVAIGLAVLAVGLVQSIILVALSRLTTYVLTLLRMRPRDSDR